MTASKTKRGTIIVGATSAIARAVIRACAQRGDRLVIAGRDFEECERIAADVRTRFGTLAIPLHVDLESMQSADFARACGAALDGAIDNLVLCQGFMADQEEAQKSDELIARTQSVNLTSVIQVCEALIPTMRAPGATICCVSSVAGDRGRPSNHIYGASKAGVNAYLEGLRSRLFKSGVNVVTVKPGFVDTAMTWGLDGMFLVADPADVGASIVRAMERGKSTVYTPFFWRGIMLIIRCIPGPIFKRLDL